ncbi:arginase family protein [Amycolatopsis nigrescens]|uniref:arginase family protein n=1 Tax=Amycolatopsis nigrescens TaxID=381445 RepID=UPI000367224A|nr:arginase family protein [Amycolatopsis nigrescens]
MLINAVPQRLGALSPRAGELPDGCRALAALASEVLGEPVHEVATGATGSSTVDGVANRAALVRDRAAQLSALEAPGGPVLTIGGDCGVELVPLGVARYRHGDGLGAVWFDAHPDLNTAATSPSGAFHGMVLRSLFGEGDAEFAAAPALAPGRAVLVGTRSFDPAERAAVDAGLAGHVPVADAADPGRIVDGVRESGADKLYLHLDLDVLDPAEFGGLNYPEPGGMTIAELLAALDALSGFEIVGAGITECVATGRAELSALVPVLEVLGGLIGGHPRG